MRMGITVQGPKFVRNPFFILSQDLTFSLLMCLQACFLTKFTCTGLDSFVRPDALFMIEFANIFLVIFLR
jgi:hypothetical protein